MDEHYFLEVRYINFAWGFQHEGIFIDINNGKIYAYKFKNKNTASWGVDKRLASSKFVAALNNEMKDKIDKLISCLVNGPSLNELEFKESDDFAIDAGGTEYNLIILPENLKILLAKSGNESGILNSICIPPLVKILNLIRNQVH